MSDVRQLCICADDFGLSEGINAAAATLAEAQKISAIGCMVRRPAWLNGVTRLRALDPGLIDVGLHLDLSFPAHPDEPEQGLARLIIRCYLGRVSPDALRAEIRLQCARFEDAVGRRPAFVDGHRHVHQLPAVRAVLIDVLGQRYGSDLPWLRNTAPPERHRLVRNKADVIHALGGRSLVRLARSSGMRVSRALLGVYDFSDRHDYGECLARWRLQARTGDVLMCHPSMGDTSEIPHAAARRREYETLLHYDWSGEAGAKAVQITPLSRLL
jgi:predicted glycoside hydrolase/deacetylase ChbG (UPF0249 family)